MLIYAMISWPGIIAENLWPYAIRLLLTFTIILLVLQVVLFRDPSEIFTGIKHHNRLPNFHSLGARFSSWIPDFSKVTKFLAGNLVLVLVSNLVSHLIMLHLFLLS
jgi:hypothetical protein